MLKKNQLLVGPTRSKQFFRAGPADFKHCPVRQAGPAVRRSLLKTHLPSLARNQYNGFYYRINQSVPNQSHMRFSVFEKKLLATERP